MASSPAIARTAKAVASPPCRRGSRRRIAPPRGSPARRRWSSRSPATTAATTVCHRAPRVDDRRDHVVAGTGAPWRIRRRANARPERCPLAETSTGPTAPGNRSTNDVDVSAPIAAAAGQRQQPGDDDVAGDAPADRREPLAGAGAHHPAGDHLGRRERIAEVRRGEDHRRAGALGGEALGGVHLDDPRAHRPDDPPAAGVGAERDRRGRRDHDPGRHAGVLGAEVAVGDQRQGDHAHRLLGVVGAVREREQAAGQHLAEPEPAGHRPGPLAADDPVADDDPDPADDEREHRRDHRRDQDLAEDARRRRPRPAPAATKVAPTTPPISACELEDGSPKYQVIRFQAIAPTSPAKITVSW